jgi:DNA polymerase I-like protein with 3'-5' exonuclease and polymerase domains
LEVRIISVTEAGDFPVYDLTVSEDASYTACGIVNHNSDSPNGQNFPKRGRFAKPFRKLFRASRGKVLVASDLSQAELRIAAWMAQEPEMLRIYRNDGDIHVATAAAVLGITEQEFRALPDDERRRHRQNGKPTNFGFIYGAQEHTFVTVAKTDYGVDFTLEEAKKIRVAFFEKYSGLVSWHERTKAFVREFGYVKSLHGLTRHLHSIWSKDWKIVAGAERNAINSPVQNFGSDLGIIAFTRLSAQADPNLIRPIGFIHDQLIAEVDENYVAEGMGWLKWVMENPPLQEWFGIVPPIPIKSDPEWGMNLGQTTELADDPEMQARVLPHVRKPDWWNDDEEQAWENYISQASVPAHLIREAFF